MSHHEHKKKMFNDNFHNKHFDLNITSTVTVFVFLAAFISFAIFKGEEFVTFCSNIEFELLDKFSFAFFGSINLALVILVILAFTKVGKIRIGGNSQKPEFSNFAWYSMLFSAGMGIGIMFYSVVEPLDHFHTNPLVENITQNNALTTTYLSWGIHAWVIYALVGLAFAFFAYNRNLPMSFRSLFYPVLKQRIYGPLGNVIDAFGIIITLFALSSSLSLGAMQVNSGLSYMFGLDFSIKIQIIIILIVIAMATVSVVSGMDKGVRILSELNIKLAAIFGLIILILGPTLLAIKNLLTSSLSYALRFIPDSFAINNVDIMWSSSWGIFYMAWWISWCVFVGIFIAKISKGRTVKEFILSVILIPTIFSIIWFSVIGTGAMSVDHSGTLSNIIANNDVSVALFAMIDLLINNQVIISLLQIFALIIIMSFFVTSSDSGSLVINTLSTGGRESNKNVQKAIWSLIQATLAIVIIIAGGVSGISLIQSILIILAVPLVFFMVYLSIVLIIELRKEVIKK